MFFLNLTAGEFFGLLGVLGGAITALYFLDRSKRRKVVSTLQFWVNSATASQQRSRKKVNQPWSLLLQLVSLLLLLLAIAQLQWGTRGAAGRDHVLLLDTSSWSGARIGNRTVLQAEVAAAARYLSGLPAQDRVLLARVDALTTPATVFTADREQTRAALRETTTSLSALDLPRALAYAKQAQRWPGGLPGEIVYLGPQRIETDAKAIETPPNLRILPVTVEGANYGIRRIEVKRGEADPSAWQALVTLMNYGDSAQPVHLRTQFAGTRFATRLYNMAPHQMVTAEYDFVTNTNGQLSCQLEGEDVLPQDNRATLQLPGNRSFAIAVYTRRPDLFRPLLNADRRISATFLEPGQVKNQPNTDLFILDEVAAPPDLKTSSLWINPPSVGSPLPVRALVSKASIMKWNTSALMAAGLHARGEQISQAKIFKTQPGDVILASVASGQEEGPAVVLRSNSGQQRQLAVIGFDPLDTHLRFTVTTPLLFANLLEWMAPEAVRTTELGTSRVGSASVVLEADENPRNLRVTTATGAAMPFTVHDRTLQLFTNKPTTAHVVSAGRERVLSLVLPDVAETRWKPASAGIASGFPNFTRFGGSSFDLWQWLACSGALGLLAEWLIFGRPRGLLRLGRRSASPVDAEKRHEEELAVR